MIGVINFTHSDPLYSSIENKEKITRHSPGRILRMILDGELDGGMVSLVSLLENDLSMCRGANIHSISTTMSTLLVSRGPPMRKTMEIAVTSHTRTTEFYTEMVLRKFGVEYRLVHVDKTEADDLLEYADYALVIGDEALKVFGSGRRILFDTGFEFSRLYHMQPIYAILAYRNGEGEPAEMEEVNSSVFPSAAVKAECARKAALRLNLRESLLHKYYSLVRYEFNPALVHTIDFVRKKAGNF